MGMISDAREARAKDASSSSSSFLLQRSNVPFNNADEVPHQGGSDEDEDTSCCKRHLSSMPTSFNPAFTPGLPFIRCWGFQWRVVFHCSLSLSSFTLFPCLTSPLGGGAENPAPSSEITEFLLTAAAHQQMLLTLSIRDSVN